MVEPAISKTESDLNIALVGCLHGEFDNLFSDL